MSTKKMPKILVVDDEEFNVDIISEHLKKSGFAILPAFDGDKALQQLEIHQDVDVIVLDRMMPKMNGMEVIKVLKKDNRYKHIPIVMQTAAIKTEQVVEGIQAGVYYYLTKPYKGALLVSIVQAALEEGFKVKEIEQRIKNNTALPNLIENGQFEFRTLDEAKQLANFLSSSFPDPASATFGLTELMVNAIEHGNLGITYDEKSKYVLEGTLYHEIERRLVSKKNENKKVHLRFESIDKKVKVHIKDQGDGFSWGEYLEISPERVTAPNGRGIATSKACFSSIEYIGKGNEVIITAHRISDLTKPESKEAKKTGFFSKFFK